MPGIPRTSPLTPIGQYHYHLDTRDHMNLMRRWADAEVTIDVLIERSGLNVQPAWIYWATRRHFASELGCKFCSSSQLRCKNTILSSRPMSSSRNALNQCAIESNRIRDRPLCLPPPRSCSPHDRTPPSPPLSSSVAHAIYRKYASSIAGQIPVIRILIVLCQCRMSQILHYGSRREGWISSFSRALRPEMKKIAEVACDGDDIDKELSRIM